MTKVRTILAPGITSDDFVQIDRREFIIAVSDEATALSAGTGKATFRMPHAFTLSGLPRASVNTAPAGAALVCDVRKNGTSIFSTLLSIDAGEKTSVTAAVPAVLSTTVFADDDEVTVDITQVGSTGAGKGLKITLIGVRG